MVKVKISLARINRLIDHIGRDWMEGEIQKHLENPKEECHPLVPVPIHLLHAVLINATIQIARDAFDDLPLFKVV